MTTLTTVECTLDIGGMTCASCVQRVEKALTKVEGVTSARVNLATEVATVSYDPSTLQLDELTEAVSAAGYSGTVRPQAGEPDAALSGSTFGPPPPGEDQEARREAELAGLKRKWQVALATGLAMMALMYVPLPIDAMDVLMPLLLVLASFVQFWAGRSVYAAAWSAARHRATNMNTLVALGTGVAYGYSAFVTLWPGIAEGWGLPLHVYFETSLVILALVLLGKWMEGQAKKRTADAIRALAGLTPKTARVIRNGTETDIPLEDVVPGDLVRVRPGRKDPR